MTQGTTRARIFAAAVAEFADHGLVGTRISSIAKRAGVNVERVYHYFGNKERLFAAVVASATSRLAVVEPFDAARLGQSVAAAAGFHAADPRPARLLFAEGQASGADPDAVARADYWRQRVDAVRAQQAAGVVAADIDARAIAFAALALTTAPVGLPQQTQAILAAGEPIAIEQFHAELGRLAARLGGG